MENAEFFYDRLFKNEKCKISYKIVRLSGRKIESIAWK